MTQGLNTVVNGHSLYYEQMGMGRPLVLLHGGLNTIDSSFSKQFSDFARQYRVTAIEQVGHGHSPDVEQPFTYRQMAEDTAALLLQLNIEGADIVGWSDGGILALLLTRWHPALVRRLVVSGTNVLVDGLEASILKWLRMTPLEQLAEGLPNEWRLAYAAVSPDGAGHWPVVVGKVKDMWLTPDFLGTSELAAIHAPVLIVSGDHDAISLEHTLDMFRALPKAQLCILPGTSHNTFQERAGWLNPIILEFLDAP
jgi:pimeloyl-ACP methyl ester carboxylesterase